MAKIQSIDPWVPSAVAFGSQVVSGIGNYFENKDRVKYQNKVAQMQEDARKRVAEAQKKSVQRANYFSLLSGRNIQAEPVDFDLPVIPAYESGGWSKALRGVGQGLGYASQATDTIQKVQEYNEQKASRAGQQSAAQHILASSNIANLGTYEGGYDTEIDRQAARIRHLQSVNDVDAWEGASGQDSSLTGMFSGSSSEAFRSAYSSAILTAHGGMKQTQNDNYRLKARLDQQEDAAQKVATAKELADTKALTGAASGRQVKVLKDFNTSLVGDRVYLNRVEQLDASNKVMALLRMDKDNYPEGAQFDDRGNITGIKLNAPTQLAITQLVQRTFDDAVVHETDIVRIQENADTMFSRVGLSIDALMNNEVKSLSPEAALVLVNHAEEIRKAGLTRITDRFNNQTEIYANTFTNHTNATHHGWEDPASARKQFEDQRDILLRKLGGIDYNRAAKLPSTAQTLINLGANSDILGDEYVAPFIDSGPPTPARVPTVIDTSGGNLPQRQHNPGNIQYSEAVAHLVQRDANGNPVTDRQKHLIFESAEAGWEALTIDITAKQEGRSWLPEGATLAEMGGGVGDMEHGYAEDPLWASKVAKILKVPVDTPVKHIPTRLLVRAIATQEGYFADSLGKKLKANYSGQGTATADPFTVLNTADDTNTAQSVDDYWTAAFSREGTQEDPLVQRGLEYFAGPQGGNFAQSGLAQDIQNAPRDLRQEAFDQSHLGGPIEKAAATAMAVPVIAAQNIGRSASAVGQAATELGQETLNTFSNPALTLQKALLGGPYKTHASESQKALYNMGADILEDPSTAILTSMLFRGNNPFLRYQRPGGGGGGGISGLLRGGGSRGLPGGTSYPSLGSGTGIGLPAAPVERIGPDLGRIYTGP
tara:strand:+ start:959 stop:3601 length:2643 start_codon:yes stop_codon:yes gene_type:complete